MTLLLRFAVFFVKRPVRIHHNIIPEQAGFRKGYKHHRSHTYAAADYSFDSIETWAVLRSLQRYHIDYRYIEVLKFLYNSATMSIRVQEHSTRAIPMQQGVRQRDVISPKLFTAALEDAFKLLEWQGFGSHINGAYTTHPRFADDIVLMAESLKDLSIMLTDLDGDSQPQAHPPQNEHGQNENQVE